jgi:hypothetical protein
MVAWRRADPDRRSAEIGAVAARRCYLRRVRGSWIVALAVLLVPASARAGLNHFGWLYDSEVNPEGGVELETWVYEENGVGDAGTDETSIWWAPTIGISDQVELALPVEVRWLDLNDGSPPRATISRFGAEVRWRLVSQDPVDAPPFAPLLRVGVKRMVDARDGVRVEGDVVVGYDVGRLHAAVDLGALIEVVDGEDVVEVFPAAGISVAVSEDLRLGAEMYGQVAPRDRDESWLIAGPNAQWIQGRFWLSGAFGIGIVGIDWAPRLNWGVAF